MTAACKVLVAAFLILPDLLAADTEFRPYAPGGQRNAPSKAKPPSKPWSPLNRQAQVRVQHPLPPPVARPGHGGFRSAGPSPVKTPGNRPQQRQPQARPGSQPRRPVGSQQNRTPLRPQPSGINMRSRGQSGNHREPTRKLPTRQPNFRSYAGANTRVPPQKNYG